MDSGGVGAFIEDTLGEVFSPVYGWQLAGRQIDLRFANINNKDRYKLLFTMGLSHTVPRVELLCCTSFNWPVNASVQAFNGALSFPMRMLKLLVQRIVDGDTIAHGFVFHRQEAEPHGLIWPEGCEAVVAVDHLWHTAPEDSAELPPNSDAVKLLLLVPLGSSALKKLASPAGKSQFLTKTRTAKWPALAFKLG